MAANRGEIATRIVRAASELGIKTAGIYAHEGRKDRVDGAVIDIVFLDSHLFLLFLQIVSLSIATNVTKPLSWILARVQLLSIWILQTL